MTAAACHQYLVQHGQVDVVYARECEHRGTTPGIWILQLPMVRPLTLNARGSHWASGYKAKKQITNDTILMARARKVPQLQRARVELRYSPPDRRRRDVDNLVATLKPAVDGLRAAGVLIDDDPAHADLAIPVIEPPRPDHKPLVYLVITDLTPEQETTAP